MPLLPGACWKPVGDGGVLKNSPSPRHTPLRPEIRQDHPLNLSISISGGKETNQDSPSSGERTGKSPTWKSPARSRRIVV